MVVIDKTFCYNWGQKGVKLNSSHFSCASVSSLPPEERHSTPHKTRCENFINCAVKCYEEKQHDEFDEQSGGPVVDRRNDRHHKAGQDRLDHRRRGTARGAARAGCQGGHPHQAQPGQAPGLLSPPHRPRRRRPRGGPHLHLLRKGRGRRPHQPLGRPQGDVRAHVRAG